MTRIQLDRKLVKPSALDRNLIQVNAQAAWDAGATGQGAKLAVLDTGVDATHPDLAGRVAAAEDFTGAVDPTDRLGHGTHVAGIAAGSGAAAAGERRGLAFDADLLVGKVCDDTGRCADSAIIAGMEWAAAQGAKVVNLSLGGPHTDGLDPVEEALERLTADRGMLFVAAAGNGGPRGSLPPEFGTISSPAEAPSALAVGAVDADEATAGFSSTGPAQGDLSLKPEITAPGVDIIAPRASGSELGEPVGENYMKLSGTSMAAPHVSGTAAALAQRFPDWSPAQLKAALVGTATPAPGTSVYDQGGGQLNAGRAATQTVMAETATVDFGRVTFPHPDPGRVLQRPVTLRNLGASEVTLDLTATLTGPDGQPAPAGTLALSADRLTLPGGQTGSVQAILTEPQVMGLYSGQVTATAGQTRISLPVAVYNEYERVDLTLSLRDRTGAHAASQVQLLALDARPAFVFDAAVDGQRTLRLAPGRYHAVTGILFDGDDPASGLALAVNPEIDATGTAPVTVTLDARQAVLAAPTIAGRQTANRGTMIGADRYAADGDLVSYAILDVWRDGSSGQSGRRPVAITPTGRR